MANEHAGNRYYRKNDYKLTQKHGIQKRNDVDSAHKHNTAYNKTRVRRTGELLNSQSVQSLRPSYRLRCIIWFVNAINVVSPEKMYVFIIDLGPHKEEL